MISSETIYSLSNNCVERINREIDQYKSVKRRTTDTGIMLSCFEWFCSKEIIGNLSTDCSPLTPTETRRHQNMQKLIQFQRKEFENLGWSNSDTESSMIQDKFSESVLNETMEQLKFV